MSKRQTLRALIGEKRGVVAPGCYDGVSARLVERAGFEAVYMTGFGTSASRMGLADMGFAGLAEMADHARNLSLSVSLPLIADADTGYGNALNVRRTVQMYESAGVAGLHLEDQVAPKRCGYLAGKSVISAEEFAQKIRAAVEARTDPDLVLIARTDAIALNGFDEAMERCQMAVDMGADMLFVIQPKTREQMETIARRFEVPLLFNCSPGDRGPVPSLAELRQMGYALIILPTQTLMAATLAMQSLLRDLARGELPGDYPERSVSFDEFVDFIGVTEQMELSERYAT